MDPVRVIVSFELNRCLHTEEFARITGFVRASRANPGCEQFDLLRDLENPNKYSFIELWQCDEALDLHTATPYFRDFVPFLAGNVTNLAISRMTVIL